MANDPYFSKVASLLPFDTAGSDPDWRSLVGYADLTNSVSVELGSSLTVVGSPTIATVGGKKAMLLNGSSAIYFTLTAGLNYAHTIVFEVYVASTSVSQSFLGAGPTNADDDIQLSGNASAAWGWVEQNNPQPAVSGAMTVGWHTVAFVYDGSSVTRLYIDGVRVSTGTAGTQSTSISIIQLGRMSASYAANGSAIRKFRAYRGVQKFTAASYTVADLGFGVGNDLFVLPWFEGGTPALTSGKLSLNGSSYLHGPGFAFGSADFTIEGWFEIGTSTDWPRLFNQAGANTGVFWLNLSNERRLCLVASATSMTVGTRAIGPTNVDTGPHHIALVRKGNALCVFLDGVAELAMPIYGSLSSLNRFAIGTAADNLGGVSNYIGTINDFRVTLGKARYDFTLEPYFYNTTLIERPNGTSYPFVDQNRNKAATSTAMAAILEADPFGGTDYMIRFNGTTSYVSFASSTDFDFGVGDFTVEWWGKSAETSVAKAVISSSHGAWGALAAAIFQNGADVRLVSYENGDPVVSVPGAYSVGWHHFVVERIGGVARIYVDGVLSGSAACTSALSFADGTFVYIGRSGWLSTQFYSGDITGLRVTKGVARYTSNFTPAKLVEVAGTFVPLIEGTLPTAPTGVTGLVRESDGSPRSCKVLAYSHATGAFIGMAVSDPSTGAFYIASPERCFCVCLDDDVSARNALIYDRLDPV